MVWVTEGEKAAEAARGIGLAATTSAHGSGSAAKSDWRPLAGRSVAILIDNDDPGRKYGQDVCSLLMELSPPARVKVVELPGLPQKGDVVEFIAARPQESAETIRVQIESIAEQTPVIKPAISGPVLRCLADVEPEQVAWLWPNRIALGKLTMLYGDPGKGKSLITLDIASRISTGAAWPDGSGSAPLGSVILLSCEDEAADTIRPRLDRAQADVRRIHLLDAVKRQGVERSFNLGDVEALSQALRQHPDTKLIVIDPVSAYMNNTDSHNNGEVRALLAPLAKLASDLKVAVVMVTHMNKGAGIQSLYRSIGSIAFVAASRAAWTVMSDPEDPERRLLLPAKNNIGNDSTGLACRIIGGAIAWEEEPVTLTADEVMAASAVRMSPGPRPYARDAATKWLREALADGPMPAREIKAAAGRAGLSEITLNRAKKAVGVRATKGLQGEGWSWELPEACEPRKPTSHLTMGPRVGLPDAPFAQWPSGDEGLFAAAMSPDDGA